MGQRKQLFEKVIDGAAHQVYNCIENRATTILDKTSSQFRSVVRQGSTQS